jgi:hypothetical protein
MVNLLHPIKASLALAAILSLVQEKALASPVWLECNYRYTDGTRARDYYVFDTERNSFHEYDPVSRQLRSLTARIDDYSISLSTFRIDRKSGEWLSEEFGGRGKCTVTPPQPLAERQF